MTLNSNEPQNEPMLARIVKEILPFEADEEFPPSDGPSFWVHCEIAFQSALALGVLKPDLARRLLAEIVGETAEQEQPWLGLVQRGEGGQPPSLSDVDTMNRRQMEGATEELAEFVQNELGL
jgi:hypothetical protein